ncbi:hypothetical protein N0P26_004560 [Acinetobacter baumannii]|jgi:hypothetical protein|uniref:Uncharacterized protein n=4 Tax=Acinetobacter TaxID=469 RepID=A0A9P2P6J4_ACIBA|nr:MULTISPECIES: hypothetical protein [Gammaproteobacteria]EKT9125539.1 hypothetical protein [Acinetobacter baumannii]EKT9126335.1 hypothetical protein [Acinetobacter baumannii]EKU3011392.1 hypothetical protein [Acinetobacter baumannii]EKU3011694.1 hypothetical protein [Acinetobacter baumannii]EKU3369024.1 hypothetical protein [Acinetobacter baumannii]
MSTWVWVLIYLAVSLMFKWIISWGGADYIKGWKSIFFLDMESSSWNEEQLRAMALFLWIAFTILFIIGLIYPEFRFYKLKNSL